MKYQITIEEKTFKVVNVEARSVEEAKAKALTAAQGRKPDYSGRTTASGFRLHDDADIKEQR